MEFSELSPAIKFLDSIAMVWKSVDGFIIKLHCVISTPRNEKDLCNVNRVNLDEIQKCKEALNHETKLTKQKEKRIRLTIVIDKQSLTPHHLGIENILQDEIRFLFFLSPKMLELYLRKLHPSDVVEHLLGNKSRTIIFTLNQEGWAAGSYLGFANPADTGHIESIRSRFSKDSIQDLKSNREYHSQITQFVGVTPLAPPAVLWIDTGSETCRIRIQEALSNLVILSIICALSDRVSSESDEIWSVTIEGYRVVESQIKFLKTGLRVGSTHFKIDLKSAYGFYEWAIERNRPEKIRVTRKALTMHIQNLEEIEDRLQEIKMSALSAYETFLDNAAAKAVALQQDFISSFQEFATKQSTLISDLDNEVTNAGFGGIGIGLVSLIGFIVKGAEPSVLGAIVAWVPVIFALYFLVSATRVWYHRTAYKKQAGTWNLLFRSFSNVLTEEYVQPFEKELSKDWFMNRSFQILFFLMFCFGIALVAVILVSVAPLLKDILHC